MHVVMSCHFCTIVSASFPGCQRPAAVDALLVLREHRGKLEAELLQAQRENMQLRFDYEQAVLEVPRLKVCASKMPSYVCVQFEYRISYACIYTVDTCVVPFLVE